MQNPHIPAMHFNTRYICTTKNWFGGGMDVTPAIKDRLKIPMNGNTRSLNIASSVAIVLAESFRQTKFI